MVDNQHRQISGYRDLGEDDIALMNEVKAAEATIGDLWRRVGMMSPGDTRPAAVACDPRWHAIARTHLEEGFSALVRSIARPEARF